LGRIGSPVKRPPGSFNAAERASDALDSVSVPDGDVEALLVGAGETPRCWMNALRSVSRLPYPLRMAVLVAEL
jgi:hypothetical protein